MLATIARAAAVPRPIARVHFHKTHGIIFILFFNFFKILENHMGGQMKGGEMKGSEARVVFITMDASWGDEKKSHVCCGVVPLLLGEGQ